MDNETVTYEEAASLLGLSVNMVYRMVWAGKIAIVRPGQKGRPGTSASGESRGALLARADVERERTARLQRVQQLEQKIRTGGKE